MVFLTNIWYHIIIEIINLKTVKSSETRKIIKKQVNGQEGLIYSG